eukprot:GHVL01010111.1.p1 GENE.GHVL01010111.1~~GHVL01010111.1.p1  ORF type:complete len:1524 (-),score=279.28 GHVL01010111.1:101-4672(-)
MTEQKCTDKVCLPTTLASCLQSPLTVSPATERKCTDEVRVPPTVTSCLQSPLTASPVSEQRCTDEVCLPPTLTSSIKSPIIAIPTTENKCKDEVCLPPPPMPTCLLTSKTASSVTTQKCKDEICLPPPLTSCPPSPLTVSPATERKCTDEVCLPPTVTSCLQSPLTASPVSEQRCTGEVCLPPPPMSTCLQTSETVEKQKSKDEVCLPPPLASCLPSPLTVSPATERKCTDEVCLPPTVTSCLQSPLTASPVSEQRCTGEVCLPPPPMSTCLQTSETVEKQKSKDEVCLPPPLTPSFLQTSRIATECKDELSSSTRLMKDKTGETLCELYAEDKSDDKLCITPSLTKKKSDKIYLQATYLSPLWTNKATGGQTSGSYNKECSTLLRSRQDANTSSDELQTPEKSKHNSVLNASLPLSSTSLDQLSLKPRKQCALHEPQELSLPPPKSGMTRRNRDRLVSMSPSTPCVNSVMESPSVTVEDIDLLCGIDGSSEATPNVDNFRRSSKDGVIDMRRFSNGIKLPTGQGPTSFEFAHCLTSGGAPSEHARKGRRLQHKIDPSPNPSPILGLIKPQVSKATSPMVSMQAHPFECNRDDLRNGKRMTGERSELTPSRPGGQSLQWDCTTSSSTLQPAPSHSRSSCQPYTEQPHRRQIYKSSSYESPKNGQLYQEPLQLFQEPLNNHQDIQDPAYNRQSYYEPPQTSHAPSYNRQPYMEPHNSSDEVSYNREITHIQSYNRQSYNAHPKSSHEPSNNRDTIHEPSCNREMTHMQSDTRQSHNEPPKSSYEPSHNRETSHEPPYNRQFFQEPSKSSHEQLSNRATIHEPSYNQQSFNQPPNSSLEPSQNHKTIHEPSYNRQSYMEPPNLSHELSHNREITHIQSNTRQSYNEHLKSSREPSNNRDTIHEPSCNREITHMQSDTRQSHNEPPKSYYEPSHNCETSHGPPYNRQLFHEPAKSSLEQLNNRATIHEPSQNRKVYHAPSYNQQSYKEGSLSSHEALSCDRQSYNESPLPSHVSSHNGETIHEPLYNRQPHEGSHNSQSNQNCSKKNHLHQIESDVCEEDEYFCSQVMPSKSGSSIGKSDHHLKAQIKQTSSLRTIQSESRKIVNDALSTNEISNKVTKSDDVHRKILNNRVYRSTSDNTACAGGKESASRLLEQLLKLNKSEDLRSFLKGEMSSSKSISSVTQEFTIEMPNKEKSKDDDDVSQASSLICTPKRRSLSPSVDSSNSDELSPSLTKLRESVVEDTQRLSAYRSRHLHRFLESSQAHEQTKASLEEKGQACEKNIKTVAACVRSESSPSGYGAANLRKTALKTKSSHVSQSPVTNQSPMMASTNKSKKKGNACEVTPPSFSSSSNKIGLKSLSSPSTPAKNASPSTPAKITSPTPVRNLPPSTPAKSACPTPARNLSPSTPAKSACPTPTKKTSAGPTGKKKTPIGAYSSINTPLVPSPIEPIMVTPTGTPSSMKSALQSPLLNRSPANKIRNFNGPTTVVSRFNERRRSEERSVGGGSSWRSPGLQSTNSFMTAAEE